MAWPPVRTRRYTRVKESPGLSNRGSKSVMSGGKTLKNPQTPRYYPKAQIRQGAEPNATFRVGADGETGDFKGLTLSNSSLVLLGSRGFSLNRTRGEGLPAAATVAYLSRHHACPFAYSSDPVRDDIAMQLAISLAGIVLMVAIGGLLTWYKEGNAMRSDAVIAADTNAAR